VAALRIVHSAIGVVVVHTRHVPVGEVIALVNTWSPRAGTFTVAT
jgi:hypothetical protein